MKNQPWVVIAISHMEWSEEPSEIEGVTVFTDEKSAREFARRENDEITRLCVAAVAERKEWSRRRGELFGDKWPLSAEESAALGPYPDYTPGCSELLVVQAQSEATLALLARDTGSGEIAEAGELERITMGTLPPL